MPRLVAILCRRCFQGYREKGALAKHEEYCKEHDAVKITLPELGSVLNFMNNNRSMRVPFILYADFESFIKPISHVYHTLINIKGIYRVHSVTILNALMITFIHRNL